MSAQPPFKTRPQFALSYVETTPAWKSITRNQRDLPTDRELEELANSIGGNVEIDVPAGYRAPR